MNVYRIKCLSSDVGKVAFWFWAELGFFFMAILVFSAASQLAVDTVEEAGVSDLSGRWWSMQIYAATVNHWINP